MTARKDDEARGPDRAKGKPADKPSRLAPAAGANPRELLNELARVLAEDGAKDVRRLKGAGLRAVDGKADKLAGEGRQKLAEALTQNAKADAAQLEVNRGVLDIADRLAEAGEEDLARRLRRTVGGKTQLNLYMSIARELEDYLGVPPEQTMELLRQGAAEGCDSRPLANGEPKLLGGTAVLEEGAEPSEDPSTS